jgi:peptidyl-prolyl cis-trans isomerase C
MIRKLITLLLSIIFILLLTACSGSTQTLTESTALQETPTIPQPTLTPTLPPLAAKINDGYVLLSDYQAEMQRLQAAEEQTGITLSEEERRQKVMDELVGQEILVQEALKNGFVLDDQALDQRIRQLKEQSGGEEPFNTWMKTNGYDDESLRRSLWKAMAAAYQRDKILAGLPDAVEQVHARQILVFSEELAGKIHGQLEAGADFATLAKEYDPVTGGDLGWFPRGYLTQPDLETAAFDLEPGAYSAIIKTSFGYHILQVIERDPGRRLDSDAKQAFQHKALETWMQAAIGKNEIEELAP